MTYKDQEESVYDGNPIELYEFFREGGSAWRFTSSDSNKTYLGNIYFATPLLRNSIEQSQDVTRAALTIEMSSTEDFIQQFIVEPLFTKISIIIRRYHESDITNQVVALWQGRVINVEQKESTASITCESSYTSLKRPTLRRLYSTSCPHLLYGPICTVPKSLLQVNATIDSISGVTIISSDYDELAPYFIGGYVEHTKDGTTVRRFIVNESTNVIQLNLPLYVAEVGDTLVTYPGCDHTKNTCNNRFNNVINYGGQPWIPQKNPMTGTSIF
ncbi:MAG: phage BR0599 family protein [Candidatus Humimicrobiaceae bacterium]